MSERNRPRVGVVTHNVDAGGAQRIAIREARLLAERGYDVTLFSLVKPRSPWTELLDGIHLEYLVDVGEGAFGEAVSRVAAGFARLPAGYDLYLAHNLPGAQLAYRANRRNATPYVAYVHDATAYPVAGSPFTLFFGKYSPDVDTADLGYRGRLGLAWEGRWLGGASAVLANAGRTRRELEDRHGLPVQVLYPTLIGNATTDEAVTARVTSTANAERGTHATTANGGTDAAARRSRDPYFLVVQRLEPHPTYDVVEALLERVPDLRVVVAGSSSAGYLEGAVRRRFERFGDRASFRVDPTDAELAGLYADAFAFLHPGVENFNMSALEAATAGRPVVVAAESGIAELFDDYPLFAPAGDVDAFERAVRRLLDDPADADRLGREAARVAAAYGDAYHVETLEAVLADCLEGSAD